MNESGQAAEAGRAQADRTASRAQPEAAAGMTPAAANGAWIGDIRWDERGLVPVIVQDDISKEVLMLAYMNEASLRKSLETGETWFWSRSRGELWHKGATSGHTQQIVSIHYDCDGDALLVRVRQNGPACHTGSYSCFSREAPCGGPSAASRAEGAADGEGASAGRGAPAGGAPATGEPAAAGDAASAGGTPSFGGTASAVPPDRFGPLNRLEATIARRHAERPEGTYTTYLFNKGLDKILKKVGEETAEVIIAAKNQDNAELRCETADLLYHLMVLLRERGLPLDDVLAELDRRHRPDQPDRREPSDRPDKRKAGANPGDGQEGERRAH